MVCNNCLDKKAENCVRLCEGCSKRKLEHECIYEPKKKPGRNPTKLTGKTNEINEESVDQEASPESGAVYIEDENVDPENGAVYIENENVNSESGAVYIEDESIESESGAVYIEDDSIDENIDYEDSDCEEGSVLDTYHSFESSPNSILNFTFPTPTNDELSNITTDPSMNSDELFPGGWEEFEAYYNIMEFETYYNIVIFAMWLLAPFCDE
ncbi:16852_t:CDS:2 [Acaulospora morrowiae]|uniref:16852_t:CDS:1 n=1 Tax=Acaulospora morrowiae TaxID=94023 RepID=A0A9N9B9M4_9GLOM|nr:16852_t:CDS:2 [Acaulospora morrowiae]